MLKEFQKFAREYFIYNRNPT